MSKSFKKIGIIFKQVDKDMNEEIRGNLDRWAGMLLNRVAWNTSQGGFMPVDTGNAITSVRLGDINYETYTITLGSNVEYMVYIEEGMRSGRAYHPFRLGTAYALRHDIMIEVDEIVLEHVDEGIFEFLDALEDLEKTE